MFDTEQGVVRSSALDEICEPLPVVKRYSEMGMDVDETREQNVGVGIWVVWPEISAAGITEWMRSSSITTAWFSSMVPVMESKIRSGISIWRVIGQSSRIAIVDVGCRRWDSNPHATEDTAF